MTFAFEPTSTKEKREAIYDRLASVIKDLGGTISRGPNDQADEINVTMVLDGYRVSVWIYAGCKNAFVIHLYKMTGIMPFGFRNVVTASTTDELISEVRHSFDLLRGYHS